MTRSESGYVKNETEKDIVKELRRSPSLMQSMVGMINNRRALERRREAKAASKIGRGHGLDGDDLVDHVSSMMGEHAVEKKKTEERIEASKGMRQQFLSSRLRNRKNSTSGKKSSAAAIGAFLGGGGGGGTSNRVAPLPDDGETSGDSGGSGGGWFGVTTGDDGGGGGGGAETPASDDAEEHVVEIQSFP